MLIQAMLNPESRSLHKQIERFQKKLDEINLYVFSPESLTQISVHIANCNTKPKHWFEWGYTCNLKITSTFAKWITIHKVINEFQNEFHQESEYYFQMKLNQNV